MLEEENAGSRNNAQVGKGGDLNVTWEFYSLKCKLKLKENNAIKYKMEELFFCIL